MSLWVTCRTYPEKFVQNYVVAPSVSTSVVIVTQPIKLWDDVLVQWARTLWLVISHSNTSQATTSKRYRMTPSVLQLRSHSTIIVFVASQLKLFFNV